MAILRTFCRGYLCCTASPIFICDCPGLEHQLCRFHTLRWVKRLLNKLQKELDEEWVPLLDEVRLLLETLPPDGGGGTRMYQLYRQIPPPPRVRNRAALPLARL